LDILFEDDYLIVVDKPPGLVSTPSETQTEDTLADILNRDYEVKLERGGLVHRLDKDTSGVIVAAKQKEAFDKLQAQFQERTVKKEYTALVHGFVKKDGEVVGAIMRNPQNREKFTVDPRGREAATEYKVLNRLEMEEVTVNELYPEFSKIQLRKLHSLLYTQYSLLRCFPKTGRTHQIRVHLKYINFPIVGDEKYGGRKVVRLDHRWCKRQFLHASKITFNHPITGELLNLQSPLPDDLRQALNYLTME